MYETKTLYHVLASHSSAAGSPKNIFACKFGNPVIESHESHYRSGKDYSHVGWYRRNWLIVASDCVSSSTMMTQLNLNGTWTFFNVLAKYSFLVGTQYADKLLGLALGHEVNSDGFSCHCPEDDKQELVSIKNSVFVGGYTSSSQNPGLWKKFDSMVRLVKSGSVELFFILPHRSEKDYHTSRVM